MARIKTKINIVSRAREITIGYTDLETFFIRDIISRCEDIEELKQEIIPMLKTQQEEWKQKVNEIITRNGFSKTSFAKACNVSRVTVDKWCKGAIPKNREMFLRIGMAANYDKSMMNQLLQRYGQYPALYSKSLEDCICIYILNKNLGSEALREYELVLDRIKKNIAETLTEPSDNADTQLVDERLNKVHSDEELDRFITENTVVFASAYYKFYAYVKMCIRANYKGYADSVFELAESQEWSSSLRQCVSAIRQNKWYPTRNKIISLGLHLSMDHEQIDDMLELAHMEPLCAKNIFESVIMFILDDASLNDVLNTEAENYDPDELCRYAREILEGFDLPEVIEFITELPENYDE